MRRNFPTIFVILALIILILCSACVSQPITNQPPQQDGGITLTTLKTESPSISFEKAYQNLMNYRSDPTNDSSAINTIYTIYGLNIDKSGNATSWVFGVRHSGGTELLAYDQSGLTRIPWDAPPFSSEINVGNIVPPNSLFSQNSAIIFSNPSPIERQDLELSRGTYKVTITSGTQERVLTFNANTGKLIS